ncbi:hypothetical protein [Lentzea sp. CC55]|uniref:hypothetical protein n=1 Tax=Lentzea sp. CC55 TaxID=2884909 RepID=UPI001F3B5E02|nr:hypothetical protein [Lentzea sp. CC55]MCG8926626.1 hypothetical protein [Lentzea sp. CC55]
MSQLREFAVRLWDGENGTTIRPLAYDAEQAELLARLVVGTWGGTADAEVRGCRPTCDYCDGLATRLERGALTPICALHAREHYGSGWRAETLHLGDKHFDELPERKPVGASR